MTKARQTAIGPRGWGEDGAIAVHGQEPIAVQWGANDAVIIRQERAGDQEEALIFVRLSNVEALVEKIKAVADDIRSSR
jgi:hypothetical protein